MSADPERLRDLLIEPRESLEVEIKGWLDLQNDEEAKANFAKAVLAIANHGGGHVIFGLEETPEGFVEANGRPATWDGFAQDLLNGIIARYADPPLHCVVRLVPRPDSLVHPVVSVSGGHRVPVRARRAGPNDQHVRDNTIYMRKPGPKSETPRTGMEWDELFSRCFANRRDELLELMRGVLSGAVATEPPPAVTSSLDRWMTDCRARWDTLAAPLPDEVGPKLRHGRYTIAYEIEGNRRNGGGGPFPDILSRAVVRHTGWPPFWVPTREGIAPYQMHGAAECWIGGDTVRGSAAHDAAHSDFWRVHPDGQAYLLRGFDEDALSGPRGNGVPVEPGRVFDVVLPIWRIGETLLQAHRLAGLMFVDPTRIRFAVVYEGLAGRELVSINGRRDIRRGRVAKQDTIRLDTFVETSAIDPNLPEILHPLLSPLYQLFDFFDLPMGLVAQETRRMKGEAN